MNLREILDDYRRQTKDRAKPYLIADPEAIKYFNKGQREAARRGRLIVDSTSDVAQVSVCAGIPLVDISPKIISARRIRLKSSTTPLLKRLVREMDEMAPGWDTSTSTSQPRCIVVDYQTDALYLYPPPKSDDTLLMTVVREPINDVADDADVPELNARYLEGVIEWMKFETFANEDTDLHDEKKASTALKRFEDEFGPPIGAMNERFEFEHYDDVGER